MKKLFVILIILFIFGCNKKTEIKYRKTFHIDLVEKISFRRNYFYPDSISNKERDELDKRNPDLIGNISKKSNYYIGLKKLNLFDKNDRSLLEKTWNKFIEIQEQKGDIIIENLKYHYNIKENKDYSSTYYFYLADKSNKNLILKKFDLGHVFERGFLIKDLDQDGIIEVVLFYHWYIVNGDNYDIEVYTIKNK
ncbi:hypothetical protein [Flavobacterium sp.]|uniref:hypothetical protein n=1 Tax=Flavobacterium sp. TaxID=239 RepID=UPI003750B1EB